MFNPILANPAPVGWGAVGVCPDVVLWFQVALVIGGAAALPSGNVILTEQNVDAAIQVLSRAKLPTLRCAALLGPRDSHWARNVGEPQADVLHFFPSARSSSHLINCLGSRVAREQQRERLGETVLRRRATLPSKISTVSVYILRSGTSKPAKRHL